MIPLCLPWAYSFPEHCPGHSIGQPDLRALPNKHRASSGTVHLPEEQQTILQPHHLPSQTEDSQRSYLEPGGGGVGVASPMEHHSVWPGDRTSGRESPWNLKGGSPSLSSHPGQPWWSNFLAAASSHLTGRSFAPGAAAPWWSQCQKALRPCKASFKMLFIRVNTIKKERTV